VASWFPGLAPGLLDMPLDDVLFWNERARALRKAEEDK